MRISPTLGSIAARIGRNFVVVAHTAGGWQDTAGTAVEVNAATLAVTLDSLDYARRMAEVETGKRFSALSMPASIVEAHLSPRKEIETLSALYRRNPWNSPKAKVILKGLKAQG